MILWQRIKDLYKKTSVSAKQTTTSTADAGTNVMTFTFGDGTSTTLSVKNGSKGSDGASGRDGINGRDGAKGEKGEKGDRGPVGETGPQGNSGITDASNKALINDVVTGGETSYLSAEVGKLGILTYDCSKGGTVNHASLQDAINAVPTTFRKACVSIIYKSGNSIYHYSLKSSSWSSDPANWFSVEEKVNDLPFMFIQDEEYLAVEQDAEGKILSTTNPDGSHYIRNAKSETIPEEFSHIEDPEGRTEITTDAEDKILGYRDSEGTRHEHKISVKHLELSNEAANEVNDAFKSAGIKMENPSDFSKESHIELPIPRIAAQVRIYAPKLPTTKQDNIEAVIEYNDKDGNYFKKSVILNAQGSSSMSYYVKNMAIDITDGSEIKFGDFPTQDSFHLKKYYIDAFRGQCIVGYWLMEQVYKSRPIGQQYPYEYTIANDSVSEGLGSLKKDFFTGAKCHPDGFPINITWVNTGDGTETDMGIYAWNLKKSKEIYYADKKKAENIILDGEIATDTLFGGTIKWSSFEIRNPKSLIDINGNKYDGDNPTELSDTDPNSKKVKDYLISLSKVFSELNANKTKDVFEKHFLVNPFIDYCLVSDVLYHIDGFRKNWIWLAYNGKQFTPSAYDMDSIFGSHYAGIFTYPNSETTKGLPTWAFPCNILYELYKDDIDARYKTLRDLGIFTVDNIMSLLNNWLERVGYDNYSKEFSIYNETPSYRKSPLNSEYWKIVNWAGTDTTYNNAKTYSVGEKCIFNLVEFECVKENAGQEPTLFGYNKTPNIMGFYNSPIRVKNWLIKKIETLDIYYNYKK